ncbi:Gamma-tubulin complex component 4 [Galdieria sulphuraria]|nr:Gamma-tubulin complex component 4 [Galdieria sulphuraria]
MKEAKRLNGPELITQLIQFCTSGSPDTASLCMRLLKKCMKVLLVQLQTWLYYGELQDPFEEFFLRKEPKTASEQRKDDSSFSLIDDIVIAQENLTSLLSPSMVKDILFIGGVVKALRNSEDASSQVDWNELEVQIDSLRSLEMQPLRSLPLQSNIQYIRQWASKQLMKFLFRVSWWKEFEFLRQTFLLGKGDLWFYFLQDICDVLVIPSMNECKESVLNSFLEKSLLKTFFEVDFRYEMLSFQRMDFTSVNSDLCNNLLPLSSGWSYISLSYVPQKPLHILMTSKDLEHYSRIFCIVFAIAHVRFQMERSWLILRNRFRRCNRIALVDYRNIFHLLWRCNFLVHCLEEYFQIGLIEESFGTFMKQSKGASDFDSVRMLHQKYLETLVKRTLIYSASFIESLDNLLQVFREYCIYIQHRFVEEKTLAALSMESMEQPINQRIVAFLQELQQYPNHPVSNMLLNRIDFNNFYFLESTPMKENGMTCIEDEPLENETE